MQVFGGVFSLALVSISLRLGGLEMAIVMFLYGKEGFSVVP
jgi:hypothetical protein